MNKNRSENSKTVNDSEKRKMAHLSIVSSNSRILPTKKEQALLNPNSAEITRIIRAKGKALGW